MVLRTSFPITILPLVFPECLKTSFPSNLSHTLLSTDPSLVPHRDHRKRQTLCFSPKPVCQGNHSKVALSSTSTSLPLVLVCQIIKNMVTGSTAIPIVQLQWSPFHTSKCYPLDKSLDHSPHSYSKLFLNILVYPSPLPAHIS